jgi:hypothetical protein
VFLPSFFSFVALISAFADANLFSNSFIILSV